MSNLRSCDREPVAARRSARVGPPVPRRRLRRLGGLVLAAALAAGCSRSDAGTALPAAAPAAVPRQSFDGAPAAIQVGPGWYRPERGWDAGHPRIAWANQVAEVYFAPPPFADAELVAVVQPLRYAGAPRQAVQAMLNRRPIGTFSLGEQWSELRIPLPARALVSPVNALVLTFDHAAAPSAVGLGGDARRLAAVFATVAVVPRGAPLDGPRVAPAAYSGLPAAAPRRPLAGRPDVFVYLIDALRADALGAHGVSPRIEEFARDAVVLDRARSPASWTLPATFSVLSGRYPFHHGVHLPGDRLPKRFAPWLPELFRRAGYETLGISQWMLGGDAFGLEQGFGAFFFNVYQDGKMPSSAARWFLAESLRRPRRPDRPLFAFLHTVAPHAPYEPVGDDLRFAAARPGKLAPALYDPQIFLARGLGRDRADVAHLRALYDGEVAAADRAFGDFLDLLRARGLYDESLIVLVADHGEEFAEHGGFDHGRTLYDELLRVPLMIKFPRSLKIAPRHVQEPASSLDLAPTLLSAIGRAPGAGFDGIDLLPALRRGAAAAPPRTLYAETRVVKTAESAAVDLTAVVTGDLKCIGDPAGTNRFGRRVPAVRTYDLRRDPAEHAPLPDTAPEQARCRAELARLAARIRAESPAALHRDVPPEAAARLRALGYVR